MFTRNDEGINDNMHVKHCMIANVNKATNGYINLKVMKFNVKVDF